MGPSWASPACGSGPPAGPHCPSSAPQPGDIKSDPKNNCTFFSCVKLSNQLISSVSNITCPDFDPSACLPVRGPFWAPVGCALLRVGVPCGPVGWPPELGQWPLPGPLRRELPLPTPVDLGALTVGVHAHPLPRPPRAPSPSCPMAAARHVSTGLVGGPPGPRGAPLSWTMSLRQGGPECAVGRGDRKQRGDPVGPWQVQRLAPQPSASLSPRHPSQRDQDPLLHHHHDQGNFRQRLHGESHHESLLRVLRDLRHVSFGPRVALVGAAAGGGGGRRRRSLWPRPQVLGRGPGAGPQVHLLQGGAHRPAPGAADLPRRPLPQPHLHPHRELPVPGHRVRAAAGPARGPGPRSALLPPGPAWAGLRGAAAARPLRPASSPIL